MDPLNQAHGIALRAARTAGQPLTEKGIADFRRRVIVSTGKES